MLIEIRRLVYFFHGEESKWVQLLVTFILICLLWGNDSLTIDNVIGLMQLNMMTIQKLVWELENSLCIFSRIVL